LPFVLVLTSLAPPAAAAPPAEKVTASWDKVTRVSQTTPTLQVVVNPPLRRGTPVHDNAFKALRDLQAVDLAEVAVRKIVSLHEENARLRAELAQRVTVEDVGKETGK
jgi:hypothetical protein